MWFTRANDYPAAMPESENEEQPLPRSAAKPVCCLNPEHLSLHQGWNSCRAVIQAWGGGESSTPAGNGWLFAAKGLSLMAEIPLWQLKSRRLFHALCCTSLPPKTPPALTINTQKAKAGVSDLEVDVEKAAGKENVCYLVMFVPFSLFISTGKMRRSMHWNK